MSRAARSKAGREESLYEGHRPIGVGLSLMPRSAGREGEGGCTRRVARPEATYRSDVLLSFSEQLERCDSQGSGDPFESIKGDVLFTALNGADIRPVKLAGISKGFLGIASRRPEPANRPPQPETKVGHAQGSTLPPAPCNIPMVDILMVASSRRASPTWHLGPKCRL